MGSGTEVHIANDALKLLEAEGVKVRLVSMPCLDRFEAQDAEYRDSVLPPSVTARVAVEAASPLGWHRWVGDRGAVVAMTTFGASAPAGALYKHFGFTGENVADVARGVLACLKRECPLHGGRAPGSPGQARRPRASAGVARFLKTGLSRVEPVLAGRP